MSTDFHRHFGLSTKPKTTFATTSSGRILAVIGTAGRDKSKPMTKGLWQAMCEDFRGRIEPGDHLVSGGAAWADHLAVHAFTQGWVSKLTLFLPAPLGLSGRFVGPPKSSASAANFYHDRFSREVGIDSLAQILQAKQMSGVEVTEEFPVPGYGSMFARNKKVANLCNAVVAYTFGQGDTPADGGTLNTWKQIRGGAKIHVALDQLALAPAPSAPERPKFRF